MATEDPVGASREAQIQRLLGAYETHLRATLPTTAQTLEQIEQTAQALGEEVKQEIQKEVIDAQGTGECGKQTRCACGTKARYVGLYRRQMVTGHGVVCVLRAYYHCRVCGKGFCPLDRALQLGSGQCSVTVLALLARFGAYLPFERAARELELICGIRLCAATVRRRCEAIGDYIAAGWAQKEARLWAHPEQEAPAHPRQLHLSLDGVMLHVGGAGGKQKSGVRTNGPRRRG